MIYVPDVEAVHRQEDESADPNKYAEQRMQGSRVWKALETLRPELKSVVVLGILRRADPIGDREETQPTLGYGKDEDEIGAQSTAGKLGTTGPQMVGRLTMDCTKIEQMLPAYTLGSLAKSETVDFTAHIDACASCAAKVREAGDTLVNLARMVPQKRPPRARQSTALRKCR